jgi:hypothetical protein
VADAILPDELQRQQRQDGLEGGDHLRAGAARPPDPAVQPPGDDRRQQDEQPACAGLDLGELVPVELSNVGDLGLLGAGHGRALVVATPRQAGETFLAQDLMDGDVAEAHALDGQGVPDVVDGVVALPQGDDALACGVAFGGALGAGPGWREEREAPGAQLAAERVEALAGVAEAVGDLGRTRPRDVDGYRLHYSSWKILYTILTHKSMGQQRKTPQYVVFSQKTRA